MTATVETVSEQLDLAATIPHEKVESAVARAITLSETDVGELLLSSLYTWNLYLMFSNIFFFSSTSNRWF